MKRQGSARQAGGGQDAPKGLCRACHTQDGDRSPLRGAPGRRLRALAVLPLCLALAGCGLAGVLPSRGPGPEVVLPGPIQPQPGRPEAVSPGPAPAEALPPAGPADPGAPQADDPPRALFADWPDRLFDAAVAACTRPGQTALRPDPATVSCESLPAPQDAAGLILSFDGTVESLPRYVMSFSADAAAEGGFIVTADSYVSVPQRRGGERRLRLTDPQAAAVLRGLLEAAGGQPLP